MPDADGPSDPPYASRLLSGELPSGNVTRLLRVFARASLDPASLVTRNEAIAALPFRTGGDVWLDENVKPGVQAGGEAL